MSPRSILVYLLASLLLASAADAQEASDPWRALARRLPAGSYVVVLLTNGLTTNLEKLSTLPVLHPELDNPPVTAGNAAGLPRGPIPREAAPAPPRAVPHP